MKLKLLSLLFSGVALAQTLVTIREGGVNADVTAAAALKTDGSAVTQPISAAALPLPSGAATSARQDTGNTSLASIDGKITAVNTGAVVVSSSALPSGAATEASLIKLPLAQGSTTSGQSGTLMQGAVTTGAPSYTTAQTSPLSINTVGELRVAIPTLATVTAAQGGNWTTRVVGNGGATIDSTVGAGTAPANQLVVGGLYNSTEISPTTGQAAALQTDAKGRLRNVIMDGAGNSRAANVNASNRLSVSVDNTPLIAFSDLIVSTISSAVPSQGMQVTGTDGTNARTFKTDTGGELQVDVLTMPTTAVSQSGTWNINNVSGTISLPTGASTAAKQPALGTAGTASPDVISVQGIASMTPLLATVSDGAGALNVIIDSGTTTVTQATAANLNATVVGNGTFAVQCTSGCTPGGSFEDNDAFTFGTTAIGNVGFVVDDTAPNAVTENSAGAARMSANRVAYSMLRDAAGNERGVNVTAGNALLVDASATTQPVSGTVTVTDGAGALNVIVDSGTVTTVSTVTNLSQMAGAAIAMNTGVRSAGTQRVTIATDDVVPASQSGTWTVQPGNTANTTAWKVDGSSVTQPVSGTVTVTDGAGALNVIVDSGAVTATLSAETTKVVGTVRVLGNAGAVVDGATGAAPPANGLYTVGLGSGATGGLLINRTICDQWVAINGTASAQLITGVSGRKIYFCGGNIQMNGGANTVSFVSGTGTVCATGITAVPGFDGATTAANGYSFAANGGMVFQGGLAPFGRTTNNADNFCILVGSATRVVGGLNYAIY